jgi:hypothetical protein
MQGHLSLPATYNKQHNFFRPPIASRGKRVALPVLSAVNKTPSTGEEALPLCKLPSFARALRLDWLCFTSLQDLDWHICGSLPAFLRTVPLTADRCATRTIQRTAARPGLHVHLSNALAHLAKPNLLCLQLVSMMTPRSPGIAPLMLPASAWHQ